MLRQYERKIRVKSVPINYTLRRLSRDSNTLRQCDIPSYTHMNEEYHLLPFLDQSEQDDHDEGL